MRLHLGHYVATTILVAVTIGITALLRATLRLPDTEMVFLIAVMVTAVWFGRGPSLCAAALSVGAFDFFFVPPYFTFSVADRSYFLTFGVMFTISIVLSELTERIKRQEREALTREQRTGVMYALTRELSSADTPARIAELAARHAAEAFAAQAFLLQPTGGVVLAVIGSWPPNATLEAKELEVAQWAISHAGLAGHGTDTLPTAASLCAPLRVGASILGVLQLLPREPRPFSLEQRAFLDVFCRQTAVALERVRLAEEARIAALRAKAEEMRSSLLSAVSHDLRTPLASITGAATALRDENNLSQATRFDLVVSICEQAERLERLVANLLDMTRLESGTLSLKRDWIPLEEMIGSALMRLEAQASNHEVRLSIDQGLPLILVDPVLFEQVFVNLLENAFKHTPPGTLVEVRAKRNDDSVCIAVCDHGRGVLAGTEERLFEKFYRGADSRAAGAGLGLAICRGITEAHGGSIQARQAPGGGLLFEIVVPVGGTPPDIAQNLGPHHE